MNKEYILSEDFAATTTEMKRVQQFLSDTFGEKFTDYRFNDSKIEPDRSINKTNRRKEFPITVQSSSTKDISVVHLDGFEAVLIKEEQDSQVDGELIPIITSTQSLCQISPRPPSLITLDKTVSVKLIPLTDKEIREYKSAPKLWPENHSGKDSETDRTNNKTKKSHKRHVSPLPSNLVVSPKSSKAGSSSTDNVVPGNSRKLPSLRPSVRPPTHLIPDTDSNFEKNSAKSYKQSVFVFKKTTPCRDKVNEPPIFCCWNCNLVFSSKTQRQAHESFNHKLEI